MKYSICIPNYNYGSYLDELLGRYVEELSRDDIEICISDNASTDNSWDVIQKYKAKLPITAHRNNINIGFAKNLQAAYNLAQGDFFVMLSSDDYLHLGVFEVYDELLNHFKGFDVIISSAEEVFSTSQSNSQLRWFENVWRFNTKSLKVSNNIECVYSSSSDLLSNSLRLMRTPFTFASTLYSKNVAESICGYSQYAIINPDKKFAWDMLSKTHYAIVVKHPFVKYRVHENNQSAQQIRSGALKHLLDQYTSTFLTREEVLKVGKMTRSKMIRNYYIQDIFYRGLKDLYEGNLNMLHRRLLFGVASYSNYLGLLSLLIWQLVFFLVPLSIIYGLYVLFS